MGVFIELSPWENLSADEGNCFSVTRVIIFADEGNYRETRVITDDEGNYHYERAVGSVRK